MTFADRVKTALDQIAVDVKALRQQSIFCIWAEENASAASNAYEWSWGNGATGSDIGIPIALNCELFAASFNADAFGTIISVHIQKNIVNIETPLFASNNSVVTFPSPVQYSVGDVLAFRTAVATGTTQDARICAWFRTK